MNMKRNILFVLALGVCALVQAQEQPNPQYLEYIEQWKAAAMQQQQEYGIPASITMAQALLESSAGQSELALNARNHFGIKCTNEWFGGVYYHDDDSQESVSVSIRTLPRVSKITPSSCNARVIPPALRLPLRITKDGLCASKSVATRPTGCMRRN